MDNRLEGDSLDAALHLLDRQVIDVDGMLVCKVDDLELSVLDDDRPAAVTRILTGPAALVPRLSNRTGHLLRERWTSLGLQYAERDVPLAVPLDVVRHLGSAVELSVSGIGLLDRQPHAPEGVRFRRMGELLGMRVRTDHPEIGGKVLDVRLRPTPDGLQIAHLVVGRGRPGALLGYDRSDMQGPWMVRVLVQRLHCHHLVRVQDVEKVDWEAGELHVAAHAPTRAAS
jgi:hypothetical protein